MNSLKRAVSGTAFSILLLILTLPQLWAADVTDARTYFSQGTRSLADDNPYQAVDSFRSALNLNPAYAEARLGMAEALFQLGEYEEAAREIDKARGYSADSRALKLLEGRILTALARYNDALEIYRRLLVQRPHDSEANRGLAEIYAIVGQRELADEAFDKSLLYSPGDRRVLLQLVLLHDEARERAQADAVMQEALRLFPDNLSVRIQAAEHYALYDDWNPAMEHLDRAASMIAGNNDQRYPKVSMLEAEVSLRKGDPANALKVLLAMPITDSPEVLYLLARAYRDLGNEEQTQSVLGRLLSRNNEDEIARMFREESLMLTSTGFEAQRKTAAAWHLERGNSYEKNFYFRRAYNEYRRAKLIFKDNPEVWIAYTGILRKMGFPEHYKDSLEAAITDIPPGRPEYRMLKERLELLAHSGKTSLAESWGITNPWVLNPAEWRLGVYVTGRGSSLPIHPGSENTLALYLADLLDHQSNIRVTADRTGFNPEVRVAEDFTVAFRESRERTDYFILVNFNETERTFSATAELYLSRTGELVGRYDELRTGQGRVTDTIHMLSESLGSGIPDIMSIVAVDGLRVLLNKGRWHGIEEESTWIVLKKGAGRPAAVDGGLSYSPDHYLGEVDLVEISEPVSEGKYTRSGDFDFISPGDQLFFLPVPEDSKRPLTSPDPAFRARLLAIP